MPIRSGRYIITNVRYHNLVVLPDPNDGTPLKADYKKNIPDEQWDVELHSNKTYSIKNVMHENSFANAGHRAALKDTVEGRSNGQHWTIQNTRTRGQYTICTTDTQLFWALEDKEVGTPVTILDSSTDRRCWWTFENAETTAAARRRRPNASRKDAIADPVIRGQSTPDHHHDTDFQPSDQPTASVPIDVVDISFLTSKTTDLRDPLKTMSEALKKVLETAKSINDPNEVWEWPTRRLRFHLDTIESQSVKLEEDFRIDGTPLSSDPTIIKTLETYASELNDTYRLMCDSKTFHSTLANRDTAGPLNEEAIQHKIRCMDDVFKGYTTALYDFATQVFIQTKQKLPGIGLDFLEEAKQPHAQQRRAPNAYGVQHNVCLQGTREKTLKAIRDWADQKSDEKPLFLLLDVAGSGKSTVAKAMDEEWKRNELLVARFFFSRDTKTTMSTDSFCSTVADAFIALDRRFGGPIKKFRARPDFGLLSFEDMFNGLVTNPLEKLDRDAILIIDALDECENEDGSRDELLNTVRSQWSANPRLRILATGRPESDIKSWAQVSGVEYVNFIQLEGNDKDVEMYIKHRLQNLPYIQGQLYAVIKNAEGLFIWARIACDLILKTADVDALLEELGKEVNLDYLYKVALYQSIPKNEQSRRAFIVVLQMILASREPLSIAELELLSPKRGIVEQIVIRMGALLLYKVREDPIRLLHATFREFLTARSKAGIYFIQLETGHHTLASGCLDFISHYSRQDDSTLKNMDLIAQRQDASFFDMLCNDRIFRTYVYSSKSWAYHCINSYGKFALNKSIFDFANAGLQGWAYLADRWYRLSTVSCLRDVLHLSRQCMSPGITETMIHQSLETVCRDPNDRLAVLISPSPF